MKVILVDVNMSRTAAVTMLDSTEITKIAHMGFNLDDLDRLKVKVTILLIRNVLKTVTYTTLPPPLICWIHDLSIGIAIFDLA